MRVLWTATELRLDFDHFAYEHDDPRLKSRAFLALNPFGTIPTIVDDGFALSESLAINLYLAKKYGGGSPTLSISDQATEAAVLRWSFWAQGAIEPWVQRDKAIVDLLAPIRSSVESHLGHPLGMLEAELSDSEWLLGAHFTLADLNVANVLSPSRAKTLNLTHFPRIKGWLKACYSRPAAREVRERYHC